MGVFVEIVGKEELTVVDEVAVPKPPKVFVDPKIKPGPPLELETVDEVLAPNNGLLAKVVALIPKSGAGASDVVLTSWLPLDVTVFMKGLEESGVMPKGEKTGFAAPAIPNMLVVVDGTIPVCPAFEPEMKVVEADTFVPLLGNAPKLRALPNGVVLLRLFSPFLALSRPDCPEKSVDPEPKTNAVGALLEKPCEEFVAVKVVLVFAEVEVDKVGKNDPVKPDGLNVELDTESKSGGLGSEPKRPVPDPIENAEACGFVHSVVLLNTGVIFANVSFPGSGDTTEFGITGGIVADLMEDESVFVAALSVTVDAPKPNFTLLPLMEVLLEPPKPKEIVEGIVPTLKVRSPNALEVACVSSDLYMT